MGDLDEGGGWWRWHPHLSGAVHPFRPFYDAFQAFHDGDFDVFVGVHAFNDQYNMIILITNFACNQGIQWDGEEGTKDHGRRIELKGLQSG